ncbi:MAG: leukocidin family pore-forming toxin [Phycisphaerae bacterium]|nr:leukocidin family pore-forming toxin [Phycisphaerae bacterium]
MLRMMRWLPVLLIPVVIAVGCGTWFPPTPGPVEPNVTPEAYLIGELEGVTADEIHDFIDLTAHVGAESNAPIIIAGGAIDELDATQQAAVKAAFEAGHTIALVHAGEDELDALHQILGLDHQYELPDGVYYAEVYALDRETDGSLWQALWLPPETTATSQTETVEITLADGSTKTTQTDPVLIELGCDTNEDQDSRMIGFVEWLDEDGERDDSPLAQAAKQQAAAQAANSNNLTDLASAFVNQVNYQQEGNNYTLSHFVYSCHSINNGQDWFFVQQYCVLNGSGAYTTNQGMKKGKYLAIVETEAVMDSFAGNGDAVGLIQSTPQTANNVTSVTSGVEFELGGSMSFSKDGPEAGLSAGMKISSSKTVNVQDIKTINKSGDNVNNAKWRYEANLCQIGSITDCFFQNCITNPPDLSISSFQPVNQWIWRMSPDVRNGDRTMRVYFGTQLGMSEEGWYFFYATITTNFSGFGRYCYISLPFPPTQGPS